MKTGSVSGFNHLIKLIFCLLVYFELWAEQDEKQMLEFEAIV